MLGPGLGAHDGDLERVTVRLDAETGEVKSASFFLFFFFRLVLFSVGRSRPENKTSLFSLSISLSKKKKMVGCFFSAHRPRDGGWAPGREIERYEPPSSSSSSGRDGRDGGEKTPPPPSSSSPFSPRGRIVAYVAKHGHGTYPTSGKQLRAGLLANDRTSSRGKAWAPRRLLLLRAAGTTTGTAAAAAATKKEQGGGPPKPSSSTSSSLCPVAALLESPELGVTVCRGCELETPSSSSSSSSSSRTMPPPTDPRATGVAVSSDEEAALFGEFEGRFGEVLAARSQGWWSRAECPVSRGVALRVAGQFWREKESLHRT